MNAIITGASRGMGKAIAEIFALHGYNLFLSSKNEKVLLETVEELKTNIHDKNLAGVKTNLVTKKAFKGRLLVLNFCNSYKMQ